MAAAITVPVPMPLSLPKNTSESTPAIMMSETSKQTLTVPNRTLVTVENARTIPFVIQDVHKDRLSDARFGLYAVIDSVQITPNVVESVWYNRKAWL